MDNPALGSGKLAAYYGYMRANNAVVLALFFLLGVGLFEARASWLVMITAGLAAAALFWRRRATWGRVAIISMAIFAGAFYCAFRLNWSRGDLVLGEEVKVAGTVLEAEPSGSLLRITASTEGSGEQIEMATFSALAPEYGDIVEATGVLKSAGGGRISFTSPVDAKIVGHAGVNPVARELFRLRDALSAKIKRALPADKSALALGILLGDKSDFTKEFSRRINKSGLAHIAALSGYNVAILSVYFSGAVDFLILHRGWRLIVTSAAILLFIIMTGAAPPSRASIPGGRRHSRCRQKLLSHSALPLLSVRRGDRSDSGSEALSRFSFPPAPKPAPIPSPAVRRGRRPLGSSLHCPRRSVRCLPRRHRKNKRSVRYLARGTRKAAPSHRIAPPKILITSSS